MSNCKFTTKILPATCAWLLLLGCTGLFFAFPCPFLISEYSIGIAVYQSLLTIFVISNFGFSTFMDPGVYPKASNELVKDGDLPVPLHKTVEINNVTVRMKWCTTCKFYRPPRSSHCSMCDCCIEVFDHHCPWVNNCVGRRNYRYFFQFLVSLTLHMVSIFSLCLIFVLRHKQDLRIVENIVSMCLMAIIGLLSVPIVGLTCFHIVLIGRGRTTNEQVTGKMRGTENPFNLGCVKNCCYLFCGPTWPGLLRKTRWMTGSKAVMLSTAAYNASDSVVKIYMETSNSGPYRNKDYNKMLQMNSKQTQEVLHSQKPLLHHHLPTEPFEPNNVLHPPPIPAQGLTRGQQPLQKPSISTPIFSYPNGGYPLIQSPVGVTTHHGHPLGPAPAAVVASAQQSHHLYTQQQQFQQLQQQQQVLQFQQPIRNHHHYHHHPHPSLPTDMKYPPAHPVQPHNISDRTTKAKSPAMSSRASSRQAAAPPGVIPNFLRPGLATVKEAGYCSEGGVRSEGACLLKCDDRNLKSKQHHNNYMHQQSLRQKSSGHDRPPQPIYHGKRCTLDRNDSDITEYKV